MIQWKTFAINRFLVAEKKKTNSQTYFGENSKTQYTFIVKWRFFSCMHSDKFAEEKKFSGSVILQIILSKISSEIIQNPFGPYGSVIPIGISYAWKLWMISTIMLYSKIAKPKYSYWATFVQIQQKYTHRKRFAWTEYGL